MSSHEIAWMLLLATGAVMAVLGAYVCFFGLCAEQRKAKWIYALTLFVYVSWIYPALMMMFTAGLGFNPEPQVLRAIVTVLQFAGIGLAIYASKRYAGYIFRIIFASIGVLVGLVAGILLRVTGVVIGAFWAVFLPVALAVLFGWFAWQRGGDVRAAWKISCFALAGGGLAASGITAVLTAWIVGQPATQLFDVLLSIISPPLKYLLLGFPSLLEIALSGVIWLVLVAAGIATQCRSLIKALPAESSICVAMFRGLGINSLTRP